MIKGNFHRKRKRALECRMIRFTVDIPLSSDVFPEMTSVSEPTEYGIANVAVPLAAGSFVNEITALLSQSFDHNAFPDLYSELIKELALSEETLQLEYYEYLKQHHAFLKGVTGDGKRTIRPPEELRALISKMQFEDDIESICAYSHSPFDDVTVSSLERNKPGFTLEQYLASGILEVVAGTCRFARSAYSDFLIALNAQLLKKLSAINGNLNKIAKKLSEKVTKYIKKRIHKLTLLFKRCGSISRTHPTSTFKPQMICSLKVTPKDGKEGDSNSYTQLFQRLTTFITLTFLNKSLWIKTNTNYYYLSKAQSLL